MKPFPTFHAAFLALAMLTTPEAVAAPRPNVILMMADDMGYSDLGCYGGEIETPYLDALAEGGVRFTQFYNAARCCPTRAALLTGLYPHQAGIGHMVGDDGIPSYQGYLSDRCVTLAEVLRAAGYATLMTGKWHVGSAPGRWPLDRGFDRYWGTPSGGGVYFKEALQIRTNVFFVHGAEQVEAPDDMYVTDTFTDWALAFIEEAAEQRDKPFFLYVGHIAPHWPLQAKPDDIAKYAGRYGVGWDAVRERRFARQKEMGLVPPDAVLSPRHPQAKPWHEMSEAQRRELAHRMAVYAAQIDSIDQNVGRLVAKLKELGRFDDTLILFLSDNGCSAEGGPGGFSRGKPDAPIGTGLSYASAGLEWANASDTPFRKFKMDVHEGGIATPLIAHWPAGMKEAGSGDIAAGRLVHEPGHVIDLMPTLAELAGAAYPEGVGGKAILPAEGRSLAALITGEADRLPEAETLVVVSQFGPCTSPSRLREGRAQRPGEGAHGVPHPAATASDLPGGEVKMPAGGAHDLCTTTRAEAPRPLFWEHQGNKAVRLGDWKAVAEARGEWELYDLEADRTEMHDLAKQRPEKLRELVATWEAWAERCGVWDWAELQRHRQQRKKAPDRQR